MNDLRTAAQQALEALTSRDGDGWTRRFARDRAIEALEAALAEPVQEPVAWRTFDGEGGYDYRTYEDNESYAAEWAQRNPRHIGWVEPLYTAPPEFVSLTEEEIERICASLGFAQLSPGEVARAVEQALKEKNRGR